MKRTLLLALAAVLIVASLASAQGRGPSGGGAPGSAPMMPGFGFGPDSNTLADYLSLTAEQKASWEAIQTELRTSVQGLHEQQRTLATQLQTALEGTDAAAIGNLMLQMKGIRTQIEAAQDAAEAKFAALLTAGQKTKFEALLAAADYLRQRGPGGPH